MKQLLHIVDTKNWQYTVNKLLLGLCGEETSAVVYLDPRWPKLTQENPFYVECERCQELLPLYVLGNTEL